MTVANIGSTTIGLWPGPNKLEEAKKQNDSNEKVLEIREVNFQILILYFFGE